MSTLSPDIEHILEAARAAPSGENAQPWRFSVEEERILLLYDAHSDASLYNVDDRAAFVSLGAALENMVVAARALGRELIVSLFPADTPGATAALLLKQSAPPTAEEKALYDAIAMRITNRKKFDTQPLSQERAESFVGAARAFATMGVTLQRVADQKKIKRLGRVGSSNEEVMLQNKELHNFFFSHVTWTKEEDAEKKVGFYIETLELPAPARALFRLFRFWPVMRALCMLGLPKVVGKGNAAVQGSAAEIGIIRIKEDSPEAFIQTGRCFERMWLLATMNGFYIQPLTGVIFLNRAKQTYPDRFSRHEHSILEREMQALEGLSPGEGQVALMYRMGRAAAPSARAVKLPLQALVH